MSSEDGVSTSSSIGMSRGFISNLLLGVLLHKSGWGGGGGVAI